MVVAGKVAGTISPPEAFLLNLDCRGWPRFWRGKNVDDFVAAKAPRNVSTRTDKGWKLVRDQEVRNKKGWSVEIERGLKTRGLVSI